MNYSKNRELIFEVVKENRNKKHLNADEIFEKTKAINPKMGIATVYRNLNTLVEEGKLNRIQVPYGKDCYDAVLEKHYHLKCLKCGRVDDIPFDVDIKYPEGVDIIDMDVTFNYICDPCKEKTEEK